jgi:8-amino-7-oxononanoate synthase
MQEPERRQNLWERVQQLGDLLGVAVQSPVIPLVVGDEATALAASAQLLKKGFHVPAIRPPTVPKNTSRSTFKRACDTMATQITVHLIYSVQL